MEVAADKAIKITTNCEEETLQTLEEIAVKALGHQWELWGNNGSFGGNSGSFKGNTVSFGGNSKSFERNSGSFGGNTTGGNTA